MSKIKPSAENYTLIQDLFLYYSNHSYCLSEDIVNVIN